jgi:hypothetical protein
MVVTLPVVSSRWLDLELLLGVPERSIAVLVLSSPDPPTNCVPLTMPDRFSFSSPPSSPPSARTSGSTW